MVKKKTIKTYCDYCGKRITKENEAKQITTFWEAIKVIYYYGIEYQTGTKRDACKECYNSYKDWIKSRKEGK